MTSRKPPERWRNWFNRFLSSDSPAAVLGSGIDVIVPVHGAFAETRRCIESVLRTQHLNREFGRLILVDDCSPERELSDYLATIAQQVDVRLLTNSANLGFVVSVNRAIAAAGNNDVILLNSDTEVVGNWLDRMALHAHADSRVATVTPFSNNATICSYPILGGQPGLPPGISLDVIDQACKEANPGRSVDLPTAVGFCMFVKRACLAEVGTFDETTFGKGYGEEVDFCQRALQKGWRHVLAGDVFVFHVGGASFADPSGQQWAGGVALLSKRYPTYDSQVENWVRNDPALPLRAAVTAALEAIRSRNGAKSEV